MKDAPPVSSALTVMIRFATTPMMKGPVGDFQANCHGFGDITLKMKDFPMTFTLTWL
jgi:hypothetical protein